MQHAKNVCTTVNLYSCSVGWLKSCTVKPLYIFTVVQLNSSTGDAEEFIEFTAAQSGGGDALSGCK